LPKSALAAVEQQQCRQLLFDQQYLIRVLFRDGVRVLLRDGGGRFRRTGGIEFVGRGAGGRGTCFRSCRTCGRRRGRRRAALTSRALETRTMSVCDRGCPGSATGRRTVRARDPGTRVGVGRLVHPHSRRPRRRRSLAECEATRGQPTAGASCTRKWGIRKRSRRTSMSSPVIDPRIEQQIKHLFWPTPLRTPNSADGLPGPTCPPCCGLPVANKP
jgi:hypothetical protein